MKRLGLTVLLGLCITPAFAQGGKGGALWQVGKTLVNPSAVTRRVLHTPSLSQGIKIPVGTAQKVPLRNFPDPTPVTIHTSSLEPVTARALLPDELRKLLLVSSKKLHAPEHFQENKHALYRGTVFNQVSDLKNLLQNGLEVKRSHYPGEIWTTPDPDVARDYALPSSWDYGPDKFPTGLPVVVRISQTPSLLAQNQPDVFWHHRVFFRNIPARYISEVDVLLEVNNKLGWYKATLEKEELVLRPVIQEHKPAGKTNIDLRVLPDEELRQAISNDDEMKLFIPETFAQADHMLFRGLRLNDIAQLQHILEHGMEVSKTRHDLIYVSPNVSIAMGYMFPHQTAQLLGTAKDEMLPVLVKIPVTERLLAENPPQKPQDEFGGRRVLYNDVPADMMAEVAVFAHINGQTGWYKVTLEDGQLVFRPAPTKTISGWIAK